jgi:hypothetical protein
LIQKRPRHLQTIHYSDYDNQKKETDIGGGVRRNRSCD